MEHKLQMSYGRFTNDYMLQNNGIYLGLFILLMQGLGLHKPDSIGLEGLLPSMYKLLQAPLLSPFSTYKPEARPTYHGANTASVFGTPACKIHRPSPRNCSFLVFL